MELFGSMAEGVVSELCNEKGFADVRAVMNCVARLSLALRPDDDPGVVCGGGKGGSGAPYSKVAEGKIRVRCTNWQRECQVSWTREGKKNGVFDVHRSCASSRGSRRVMAVCT